ncbi:rhodanese-like domain-containing protein [Desulfosarcina sp.]|uniref:rhodanese-like domain-containing protein n=1 Tax=Desulfosarcina sp. TaxID=2027861 RepID=UPI0029B8F9BC|nr:rhodanese-like domain-containing protein [Desulfosarcina sp.]MDX2455269.1 rhodanese-like domain-containing protein [Desulfosarcina sp.]
MVKQAVKEAFILILAAVGIALAVYAVRPDKIGGIPAAVDQGAVRQSPTESGFSEISIEEALGLYEEKSIIFADARHAADFEAGHIKGAVHLYTADQGIWLTEFLAVTDPAAVIVTYCDGEDCHLATELADLLFINGFDNVRYLKNGWTRWREGGYPVESSNAGG